MRESDLLKFKDKLLAARERLRAEIPRRQKAIVDSVNPPGEIFSLGPHYADYDTVGMEREISVGEAQTEILAQVEEALERIAEGDYGVCEECGSAIAKERLEALPYATLCINCEREVEADGALEPKAE